MKNDNLGAFRRARGMSNMALEICYADEQKKLQNGHLCNLNHRLLQYNLRKAGLTKWINHFSGGNINLKFILHIFKLKRFHHVFVNIYFDYPCEEIMFNSTQLQNYSSGAG